MNRERYANDPRVRRSQHQRLQRFVAKKQQIVYAYLCVHPCVDCGVDDPVVLEFDHVRGEKLGNISHMITDATAMGRLRAEMAKCEVVCANCHRRRTGRRGNHYRYAVGNNQ